MILQCEQCNTRFRLDDSKLKPGGVKVRCSKCRHVFLAGAEPAHEESEFEAVLSGLGASVPGAEPAAPAAFDAGAAEPAAPPAAAEEPPASEEFAGFAEEPFAEQAAKPAEPAMEFDPFASLAETNEPEPAAEAAAAGAPALDFGEFAEPAPAEEKPAEEPTAFGELSFDEEPAAAVTAEPAPAATEAEVDFGAFSFEEPAAPAEAAAPAAVESAVDFSEFSLEEAAAPTAVTPAPGEEPAGAGFQEFSFEEPVAASETEPPVPTESAVFGEFSFEEGAPAVETPAQPAASSETAGGFQEFSFEEEPAPSPEPAAESAAVDFGEFSFEEAAPAETAPQASAEEPGLESFSFDEPAPEAPSTPAAAESALDFGEFSFEEPSAAPAPEPEAQVQPAEPPQEGAPHPEGESLDFGDFSFDQDLFKTDAGKESPAPSPSLLGKEGGAPGAGADATLVAPAAGIAAGSSVEADEIPPFPVSSRRRGRSALTVSLVAICVVMVVALSGIGFYVMQSGPAAFDKLGIGFVGKWFGMESPEEGRINISNTQASFHQNKEAGELFVVRGRAVNTFKKARASIHIKVTLYDKAGRPILQKTAYCGNKLTDDQLATLPMAKIDSVMNNQFGDSLANMGVAPDKSIPFVVAIANVPKEAADFGVESIGSTVSGP